MVLSTLKRLSAVASLAGSLSLLNACQFSAPIAAQWTQQPTPKDRVIVLTPPSQHPTPTPSQPQAPVELPPMPPLPALPSLPDEPALPPSQPIQDQPAPPQQHQPWVPTPPDVHNSPVNPPVESPPQITPEWPLPAEQEPPQQQLPPVSEVPQQPQEPEPEMPPPPAVTLFRYQISGASSTNQGVSTWGIPSVTVTASIEGNTLRLIGRKTNGGSFSERNTVYLKIGEGSSRAVTWDQTTLQAGESSVELTKNLSSVSEMWHPNKQVYLYLVAESGGYTAVGPITLERHQVTF